MAQQPRIVIFDAAVPVPSPQPTGAPTCARCGHQGPAGPIGALRGHRPVVVDRVVAWLQCAVPGCSCSRTPVAAEWWRP